MAAKIDKLTQELKNNYSDVQSKDIEIKDIKTKSEKEYMQSVKSFNSDLTKSLTQLKKKGTDTKAKFEKELLVLQAANKLETDELITASKKIVRSNTSKVKKIDSDYEKNVTKTNEIIASLKVTYDVSFNEIETKYNEEVKESNARREVGLKSSEDNLNKISAKIEKSLEKHKTNLENINTTAAKELDDTKALYMDKLSSAENELKTMANENFVSHQALKNSQKEIFDKLEEKIIKEENTYNKKMAALDVSINTRIERYEKFMKKREEENDAKGVKDQLREIKKTNAEKEKQQKILNKNHLSDSKKLESDKAALIKSQILDLSNLDKENCSLLEEETHNIELLKLESEKAVFDIDINHKTAIDKEKVRHDKELKLLETEKARFTREKALTIINEDFSLSESKENFIDAKSLLLEVYNKDVAENEFRLEELKYNYEFDIERARIQNELAIAEHEINVLNTNNKHKKDELTLMENEIISDYSLVFSEQFAKSLEFVKYQNAFAIKNSEYTLKLEEYEELEANNRYSLKIAKLQDELESITNSFAPVKEKINNIYEEEIKRYNELIEHTTSDQKAELEAFEVTKNEEITTIKEAKVLLPKRGNRKQIKLLNKQISKMESDLVSELKLKQEAIDKRVTLYTGEIAKAKARRDNALAQTDSYQKSETDSYKASIELLQHNLSLELENINNRKLNSIKEAKEFDLNARTRRELTIDQNKEYQFIRSQRHEDIIKKLEDDYSLSLKTNKENLDKTFLSLNNDLEKKEENLEKTLKPLRNNLIAFVTASTRRQEEIKKTVADNIEDAKKAMRTGLNNADKAEQEALAHLESELAGREAILSFSKNEISNAVSTFKKEYETKVKLQNKLYKEKLSEELAKISNQLTTELSNLTQ